ncbi:TerB N-terminal domain-containing protein [Nocardioides sp. LMS-CY]|uniref:tellurite resistance TerB family protein n=1 Tax=Nocardioides sp. (strain LMS-CY) TaxID=2840457 RepID=UPI001C0014CE|nr:TerB N-terminal domain-containing protein [Nocardioides sp. LMS-CY]QWF21014.1 TerB N-terminal domain-containing protein [Nocardioides sp. LMS-CY]
MKPPAPARAGVHQVERNVQWYGPGTAANVAGVTLPGGMFYVGRGMKAASGYKVEPALIDPTLKADTRNPDYQGRTMGYWPSYNEIPPRARGGYLSWLANGRSNRAAYIGYVFLFFYGLERRALVDIARDKSLRWELPNLRAEVSRLLGLYGDNGSFQSYATRFLDVLDFQLAETATGATPPPLDRTYRWEPPVSLLVELGSLAADGKPVPADWALAWAWYHPDIHLRTPAHRCTNEFVTLFRARYTEAYGDGLVPRVMKAPVRLSYHAASGGLSSVELTMDGVPNVFNQAVAVRKLSALMDSVTTDLDAYSRFIGRNPEGASTLAAAALLPAELSGAPNAALTQLHDWAAGHADSGAATTGADLFTVFESKSPERLSKPETVTLAQLLERLGLGVEPDVRLGGAPITPSTPVVVFRSGPQPPSTATLSYTAATTLLHLATAVSAADGYVSPEEQAHLVSHLQSALELSPGERTRLEAHLRWLTANGVKLTGLTKRVSVLDQGQRSAIGDLLVAVAAADGVISPEEVSTLTKIYKLIELNPAEVHSRLHAHLTGAARPAPATGPVTVRAGGEPDAGYPITEPPAESAGKHRGDEEPGGVGLDLASIEAKFAETAAVSALLADIFNGDSTDADQDPTGPPSDAPSDGTSDPAADVPVVRLVADLDAPHSAFVLALVERETWSRVELEELAALWQLMPDGAIDRINEAALDAADETLLDEDDDTYTINAYAREELLP